MNDNIVSKNNCDFSGYATKYNILCSDNVRIEHGAFDHMDGKTIPMVWMHNHQDVDSVIGHCTLESREDGVYAYCKMNTDVPNGAKALSIVKQGDVCALSIFANGLVRKQNSVTHGNIKEVSLVIGGANSGALIDYIKHSDIDGDSFVIEMGINESDIILHYDDEGDEEMTEEHIYEVLGNMSEESQNVVNIILDSVAAAKDGEDYSTDVIAQSGLTMDEISDTLENMTEEETDVVSYLIGATQQACKEDEKSNEEGVSHSGIDLYENYENEGDYEMGNIFERNNETLSHGGIGDANVLKHSDGSPVYLGGQVVRVDDSELVKDVIRHAMDVGSMRVAFNSNDLKDIAYAPPRRHMATRTTSSAIAHGIVDMDKMNPDAHNLTAAPTFIRNPNAWVEKVLNGVKPVQFAKIKMLFADITAKEARARGYVKGDEKVDEMFSIKDRVTSPCTIYKHQTFDRDDIIDLGSSFDFVSWIKNEMEDMLDEELARAILIGDGRQSSDKYKIKEDCVRPIALMEDLFVITRDCTPTPKDGGAFKTKDEYEKALLEKFIEESLLAREDYRGSGDLTMYSRDSIIRKLMLLKDKVNRDVFESKQKLADKLDVKELVPVFPMSSAKTKDNKDILSLYVNLGDYRVGTDKDGEKTLFDDFDINFNKQIYLIEGRSSGSLVVPKSAIVITGTSWEEYHKTHAGQ